jgi:hypothetical protein
MTGMALDSITMDADLQPRTQIHDAVMEEYASS